MTDIRNSGYLAAAQTALDTDLNSLASNTWSTLSGEIDNSTTGYMFADFEADLASYLPIGASAALDIFLLPSVDDTQYPTYTASGTSEEPENQQYYVGSIAVPADTEVHIHMLRGVELPPGKFKLGVRNKTGASLASSGSTLKWRPWAYKSA